MNFYYMNERFFYLKISKKSNLYLSWIFYDYFFLLIIIETIIIKLTKIIIPIIPAKPKVETILLPSDIIIPASKTPRVTAKILVLKSIFKKLAASVPVHAPSTGKRYTNKKK